MKQLFNKHIVIHQSSTRHLNKEVHRFTYHWLTISRRTVSVQTFCSIFTFHSVNLSHYFSDMVFCPSSSGAALTNPRAHLCSATESDRAKLRPSCCCQWRQPYHLWIVKRRRSQRSAVSRYSGSFTWIPKPHIVRYPRIFPATLAMFLWNHNNTVSFSFAICTVSFYFLQLPIGYTIVMLAIRFPSIVSIYKLRFQYVQCVINIFVEA